MGSPVWAAQINMIDVTLLNNRKMVINAELIEVIEETPDTIITLTSERKIIVREKSDEIISRVISYRRRIYNNNFSTTNWEDYKN